MYIDSCLRHGVLPNAAILYGFFKAEVRKSCNELCSMDIVLDQLKDIDFPPLLDVCVAIVNSEIEAVDVFNESSCVLNGECALSLMRAFNQKLRVVDLHGSSLGKDFLRELSRRGLAMGRKSLKVLVQVNTSGEESKSGVEPSDCVELPYAATTCTEIRMR